VNSPWYRKLHWQIIGALVAGLLYGIVAGLQGWTAFTSDWITPFGVIFLNLLTLIAVPLVFATLVVGLASLANLRSLSRIGARSLVIFVGTSLLASTIAIGLVAGLRPGDHIPPVVREQLAGTYETEGLPEAARSAVEGTAPLQLLVDMVPQNAFAAASDNRNLLQVIVVAILAGIALLRLPEKQARPVRDLMSSVSDTVIAMVGLVMKVAPLGVFALLADAITGAVAQDPTQMAGLFRALLAYGGVLTLALAIQTFVVFAILVRVFTRIPVRQFYAAMVPAQLLAFSTSSSAATLPVTMRQCREALGTPDEVTGFVVPLGSTLNMNGTAMFLCVASGFLIQGLGVTMTASDYFTVLVLATMGSVGAVAIPSIGIVFLLVILQTLGLPTGGIALILSVDRILDMMRTTTNVTGDGMAAAVIAAAEPRGERLHTTVHSGDALATPAVAGAKPDA
jgi:proton glutamate symport protein